MSACHARGSILHHKTSPQRREELLCEHVNIRILSRRSLTDEQDGNEPRACVDLVENTETTASGAPTSHPLERLQQCLPLVLGSAGQPIDDFGNLATKLLVFEVLSERYPVGAISIWYRRGKSYSDNPSSSRASLQDIPLPASFHVNCLPAVYQMGELHNMTPRIAGFTSESTVAIA